MFLMGEGDGGMQMFVIGHDCGHRSFSENKLVEDIVGTVMFMPLIYPFEPWRIKHNTHHAHTNKCAPCSSPMLHRSAWLVCGSGGSRVQELGEVVVVLLGVAGVMAARGGGVIKSWSSSIIFLLLFCLPLHPRATSSIWEVNLIVGSSSTAPQRVTEVGARGPLF